MFRHPFLAASLLGLVAFAAAERANAQTGASPIRIIPAPGGEVVLPSEGAERAYDEYSYAAARRAGDTLYISGVVTGIRPGAGEGTEAYQQGVRNAFRHLESILAASGLTFADVTMINSFHVWESPAYPVPPLEHFAAFQAVMREFMSEPWPAWTAVGTTGLLAPRGIDEIQMIAHAPEGPPQP